MNQTEFPTNIRILVTTPISCKSSETKPRTELQFLEISLGSNMKITSPVTRNSMLAIVLVCILCVCTDASPEKPTGEVTVMERRYNTWLKQHGKTYYSKDEWNMRFGIYQSNVRFIGFVNAQNLSYKLTDNQFADMTNFEFQTTYLGYKSRGRRLPDNQQHSYEVDNHAVPSSIDWRKKGAVTSIKNQDSCGTNFFLFVHAVSRTKLSQYTHTSHAVFPRKIARNNHKVWFISQLSEMADYIITLTFFLIVRLIISYLGKIMYDVENRKYYVDKTSGYLDSR